MNYLRPYPLLYFLLQGNLFFVFKPVWFKKHKNNNKKNPDLVYFDTMSCEVRFLRVLLSQRSKFCIIVSVEIGFRFCPSQLPPFPKQVSSI